MLEFTIGLIKSTLSLMQIQRSTKQVHVWTE